MPHDSAMSGCSFSLLMSVMTQMSSVLRWLRNGRTSRNFRRGSISSLTLISSMNTRLTGSSTTAVPNWMTFLRSPHSQSLPKPFGYRPQRAPAASRRTALMSSALNRPPLSRSDHSNGW